MPKKREEAPAPILAEAIMSPSKASEFIPADRRRDMIVPWLVSGGATQFLYDFPYDDNWPPPEKAGIQLICYIYIPPGTIGFIKSIRVAPYRPSVFELFDIYAREEGPSEGDHYHWFAMNWPPLSGPIPEWIDHACFRPMDYWRTPIGWEAIYQSIGELSQRTDPPTWRWSLRFIKGSIDDLRVKGTNLKPVHVPEVLPIPPEELQSMYLAANVPVPEYVYHSGLPGSPPGVGFQDQRYQIIQGDCPDLHIPIPENTTACLFARWRQSPIQIAVGNIDRCITINPGAESWTLPFYALLPSFGQMAGYLQSINQKPGIHNSQYGW